MTDRRSFLVSGAVAAGAAIAAAGKSEAAAVTSRGWDVIIIGGGNAGMPAAIFAARRGGKVLVVEAAGQLGGTLHLSSGSLVAAGTKIQKKLGIQDEPQLHYDDVMRISKNTADPLVTRLVADGAGETVDWLFDNGYQMRGEPTLGNAHDRYGRARLMDGVNGGRSILKVLNEQIQPLIDSGKITVLLNTKAKDLITGRGGAVTGVTTLDAEGKAGRYMGKNVLLTVGGCASNKEMFEIIDAPFKNYNDSSYPFSQGDGLVMGQKVGGYIRNGQNQTLLQGGIMESDEFPCRKFSTFRPFPTTRPPYEIYVGANGKRFFAEDVPSYDIAEQAAAKQPGVSYWIVFDDSAFYNAPQIISSRTHTREQYGALFNKRPFFHKADTLQELAKLAGFDGANIGKTVADYNRAVEFGNDELGRKIMPSPIATKPYYAIKVYGWKLMSFGGLAVDGQLRVIRKDGSAIPNLYAAGEILGAGTTMGKSHCGGMCVTPALTLGRLLGAKMLPFGNRA